MLGVAATGSALPNPWKGIAMAKLKGSMLPMRRFSHGGLSVGGARRQVIALATGLEQEEAAAAEWVQDDAGYEDEIAIDFDEEALGEDENDEEDEDEEDARETFEGEAGDPEDESDVEVDYGEYEDPIEKAYEQVEERVVGFDFSDAEALLLSLRCLPFHNIERVEWVIRAWCKWKGGNVLKCELLYVLRRLRVKWRRLPHAWELSTWMLDTSPEPLQFDLRDKYFRLDIAARQGRLLRARRIFDLIPREEKCEVAYNLLLMAATRGLSIERARKLFQKLMEWGWVTSCYQFNMMASMYVMRSRLDMVKDLHHELLQLGLEPDDCFLRTLATAYYTCDEYAEAQEIYDKLMQSTKQRDRYRTYLSMFGFYRRTGELSKAVEVLEMIEEDLEKEAIPRWSYRYKTVMDIYGRLGDGYRIQRLWEALVKHRDGSPRAADYAFAMGAWARMGEVQKAQALFKEGEARQRTMKNSVLLTEMMHIYGLYGMQVEAEALMNRMVCEMGLQPPASCYHSLLSTFAKQKDFDKVLMTMRTIRVTSRKRADFKPTSQTLVVALECFAEAGDISNSQKLLSKWMATGLPLKAKAYNELLKCYRVAGKFPRNFVERMLDAGIRPNLESSQEYQELLKSLAEKDQQHLQTSNV